MFVLFPRKTKQAKLKSKQFFLENILDMLQTHQSICFPALQAKSNEDHGFMMNYASLEGDGSKGTFNIQFV